MSIKRITTEKLRRMKDCEGLVLQGCGGDLKEWQQGINDIFTDEGLLLDHTTFENIYVFEYSGVTNLVFLFDETVKLNIAKLAIWRLQSHEKFGGMWLSDYVDNRLGGFVSEKQQGIEFQKPDCPLIGQDGNIFNLMGIASRTLQKNGLPEQATQMCNRIQETAGSYYEALNIIGEYVNITSVEESESIHEGMGWSYDR